MSDVAVGIGLRSGVTAAQIRRALREVLGDSRVRVLATIDRRADEPGLLAVAAELDAVILPFSAAELDRVTVPTPAGRTRDAVGTASVAEAAALLAGTGQLVFEKTVVDGIVLAVTRYADGSA